MKYLILLLSLTVTSLAIQPYDWLITRRNSDNDANNAFFLPTSPTLYTMFAADPSSRNPVSFTMSPEFAIDISSGGTSGTTTPGTIALSTAFYDAMNDALDLKMDITTATGLVATMQADIDTKQPSASAFNGVFASLTSKPTTLTGYGITDGFTTANARSAISLTTTGSGTASYSSSTGVLNVPTPSSALVTAVSSPLSVSSGTLSVGAVSTSVAGTMSAADKTKLDSIAEEQRAIITVAGGAGRVTWTYPAAYGSGIVPVIQAAAVKPTASTGVSYNTAIWGDPTNTSVTIEVTAINNNITGILALIGVGTPAPNGTKIHIVSKAP